MMDPMMLTFC